MNQSLPNEKTDVIFKIKSVAEFYSGSYINGSFYTISDNLLLVSYLPKNVESWVYADIAFNEIQAKKHEPEPETFAVSKPDLASMWEQRRYEIAKQALSGVLLAYHSDSGVTNKSLEYDCESAICYADTLIEMLKKTGQ